MDYIVGGIVAGVGVVLAAFVSTRVARRQTATEDRRASGTVASSQALDLWDAAEEIRKEMRAEVVALREEVVRLRADVVRLQATVVSLEAKLRKRT